MNILINHRYQAFYLTSFCFLPLVLLFIHSTTLFTLKPSNMDTFTLAIQQFVSATPTQPAQEIQKETPKPIRKPIEKPIAKPIEKAKEKPTQKPIEKPVAKPIEKTEQTLKKITKQEVANSTPTTAQEKAPMVQSFAYGKDENPFLRAVKSAIDNAITYPRQARKMRVQGRVLVEFFWSKDKTLSNIKILQSSGHQVLDKSAVKTIKKASLRFPAHTNDVKMQIPIVFDLRG